MKCCRCRIDSALGHLLTESKVTLRTQSDVLNVIGHDRSTDVLSSLRDQDKAESVSGRKKGGHSSELISKTP